MPETDSMARPNPDSTSELNKPKSDNTLRSELADSRQAPAPEPLVITAEFRDGIYYWLLKDGIPESSITFGCHRGFVVYFDKQGTVTALAWPPDVSLENRDYPFQNNSRPFVPFDICCEGAEPIHVEDPKRVLIGTNAIAVLDENESMITIPFDSILAVTTGNCRLRLAEPADENPQTGSASASCA